MPKPFYNSTDAELASGSTNAVSIVTASPASYGLTALIVASYTAMAGNFNTLLALSTAPATRTTVAVGNKTVAGRFLKAASVNMARIITATPAVTNAQLLALRMNTRVIPSPRPVPPTAPTVEVIAVTGRAVKFRVHDAASGRRGIPFGAAGANIYSFVGAAAPTDPREYHFEGLTTRASADLLFPDSVASGATVWLSACWVSGRGQTGIGSTPMSFTLQGGAIAAAA